MAASTTTTLNDITYSAAIDLSFLGYLVDFRVIEPTLQEYDLQGRGSAAIDVPSLATNMTVNDGGSAVATAFNGTEGTDLSTTTTQSTNKVTITSSEYAVYMIVTDNVAEDSIPGGADAVMNEIMENASEILLQAYEDDVWALLVNLGGGALVGTSGSAPTLANLNTCVVTIRNAGVRAPDGLVGMLAAVQASDIEDLFIATNAAAAVYAGAADRFYAFNRDQVSGIGNGFVFSWRNIPFFMSGLADLDTSAADRVGAVYVPSTPRNRRYAALGKTISRPMRLEVQRDATQRGDELVTTMRWGSGELQDSAGVPLATDA